MIEQGFFEGVKSEVVALRYYDWMMVTADFPAPMARVQELLPSDKLKPARCYQAWQGLPWYPLSIETLRFSRHTMSSGS